MKMLMMLSLFFQSTLNHGVRKMFKQDFVCKTVKSQSQSLSTLHRGANRWLSHYCHNHHQEAYISNKSNSTSISKHLFSVAPMMDYTNCHQHTFQRLLSPQAILYTEMIGISTLAFADNCDRYLKGYLLDLEDHDIDKVVLQLGGSSPEHMSKAAKIAVQQYGFREININCGCPSDKVAEEGCFGAALMLNPNLVCDLVQSVTHETSKPATIKCRIGVNDEDSYDKLHKFIDLISTKSQVNHFIIHARKAILGAKFSPEDNRKIPPLKYDFVYRLVQDFPNINFSINGGVLTYDDIDIHIKNNVHGVMVGRAVVDNPWRWRFVSSKVYGTTDIGLNRREILEQYAKYADKTERADPKTRRALIKVINTRVNSYLFCALYTTNKYYHLFLIGLHLFIIIFPLICMHTLLHCNIACTQLIPGGTQWSLVS